MKEINKFISKNKRLFSKELSADTLKRLERNQELLSMIIEGDIIEYVENERDIEEREYLHRWAIYMGNSMIMRLDINKNKIIYESYWKIANGNYIFVNKDLDRKLITLPIYETLYRARKAHKSKKTVKKFSSDKNFAMWCRFNINRSDIEFATDNGKYSSHSAREFIIQKFFASLELAEEHELKLDTSKEPKTVKVRSKLPKAEKKNASSRIKSTS